MSNCLFEAAYEQILEKCNCAPGYVDIILFTLNFGNKSIKPSNYKGNIRYDIGLTFISGFTMKEDNQLFSNMMFAMAPT